MPNHEFEILLCINRILDSRILALKHDLFGDFSLMPKLEEVDFIRRKINYLFAEVYSVRSLETEGCEK